MLLHMSYQGNEQDYHSYFEDNHKNIFGDPQAWKASELHLFCNYLCFATTMFPTSPRLNIFLKTFFLLIYILSNNNHNKKIKVMWMLELSVWAFQIHQIFKTIAQMSHNTLSDSSVLTWNTSLMAAASELCLQT